MKIDKKQIIGIIAGIIILAIDLIFLRGEEIFYFILGIAIVISFLPFIVSIIIESNKEKENNEMFLEFARDLVESVKTGTPISRSIFNLKGKYYGSLTPHIQKLANQISLGISVRHSLEVFSRDVNSRVVKRAVRLISEAEKAGGDIEKILESVANSVNETEKLKKERKAAVYSLVVQGYIIFLIFVVIMLVMQFKILPMTTDVASINVEGQGFGGGFGGGNINVDEEELTKPLLYLLVVQGLFAGLVIGKLAEGKVKSGIKHSFIMVGVSLLLYTGVKAFF